MPELYRNIDLSSHNAPIDCTPVYDGLHRVPPDFTHRRWGRLDLDVFEKQLQFTRTLQHDPGLGKHAHVLCWTVFNLFECDETAWEGGEEESLEHKIKRLTDEYPGSEYLHIDGHGSYGTQIRYLRC